MFNFDESKYIINDKYEKLFVRNSDLEDKADDDYSGKNPDNKLNGDQMSTTAIKRVNNYMKSLKLYFYITQKQTNTESINEIINPNHEQTIAKNVVDTKKITQTNVPEN